MKALLLKDVKASALLSGAIVALYAVTSVTAARAEEALFWLSVTLTVSLWIVPLIVDWQAEADRFICSLPVDRVSIVRARAAWILATTAAGAGLWVGFGLVWHAVHAEAASRTTSVPMWASFEGLVAFIILALVLAALFLPCYVRLGIGRGSAVFGALVLALLAVTAGLTHLGVIAPSAAASGRETGGPLPAASVQQAIGLLRDGLGVPGSLVLIGGCAAVAFWMSMWLATRFYEQREF